MSPWKRSRPNPAAESAISLSATMPPDSRSHVESSAGSLLSAGRGTLPLDLPSDRASIRSQGTSPKQAGSSLWAHSYEPETNQIERRITKTRSWYGSRGKSEASTAVAHETILGGTSRPNATADLSRFDTRRNTDNTSLSSLSESKKSLRKAQVVRSGASKNVEPPPARSEPRVAAKTAEKADKSSASHIPQAQVDARPSTPTPRSVTAIPDTPEMSKLVMCSNNTETPPRSAASSGWFGWFGRPVESESVTSQSTLAAARALDEAQVPKVAEPTGVTPAQPLQEESIDSRKASQAPAVIKLAASGGSWFGFWSRGAVVEDLLAGNANGKAVSSPTPKEPEDASMEDVPPAEIPAKIFVESPPTPKAGSTWAFWSRDSSSTPLGCQAENKESGRLAVIGETSESRPTKANSSDFDNVGAREPSKASKKEDKSIAPSVKDAPAKKTKWIRPESMEIDEPVSTLPGNLKPPVAAEVDPAKAIAFKTPSPTKTKPPNLLLPSFRGTYRLKENPFILRQVARLLFRTQSPLANHLSLSNETPKIKKAVAIGVHGLFPANYLRPMIGQPTGTSLKFANQCAEGIRRWSDGHGCSDVDIEKIALEGEGRIGERVENLWKLLLDWIDTIRKADLIVIACHSQGVPVGIMLLAKLTELNVINGARIGVCAMAGVSLGPFPDYRSGMGMLMGAASELWEFANPKSEISQKLEASMKAILEHGARVTFIGSIDDQLVPLESAIYSPAHHPYIFRAVFIDGRIHAPDFIAHLVGFALKLRNLGIADHGLIRELSIPLAGSLVGGEGHSRLYHDDRVYDLAISHALETADLGLSAPPANIHKFEPLRANPNPYHLPWIMRGLLEEDLVKTELSTETAELIKQFDDWKPVNKALKDVKYRLEAVRSKL